MTGLREQAEEAAHKLGVAKHERLRAQLHLDLEELPPLDVRVLLASKRSSVIRQVRLSANQLRSLLDLAIDLYTPLKRAQVLDEPEPMERDADLDGARSALATWFRNAHPDLARRSRNVHASYAFAMEHVLRALGYEIGDVVDE
jgi:hypothetical protein